MNLDQLSMKAVAGGVENGYVVEVLVVDPVMEALARALGNLELPIIMLVVGNPLEKRVHKTVNISIADLEKRFESPSKTPDWPRRLLEETKALARELATGTYTEEDYALFQLQAKAKAAGGLLN